MERRIACRKLLSTFLEACLELRRAIIYDCRQPSGTRRKNTRKYYFRTSSPQFIRKYMQITQIRISLRAGYLSHQPPELLVTTNKTDCPVHGTSDPKLKLMYNGNIPTCWRISSAEPLGPVVVFGRRFYANFTTALSSPNRNFKKTQPPHRTVGYL